MSAIDHSQLYEKTVLEKRSKVDANLREIIKNSPNNKPKFSDYVEATGVAAVVVVISSLCVAFIFSLGFWGIFAVPAWLVAGPLFVLVKLKFHEHFVSQMMCLWFLGPLVSMLVIMAIALLAAN